MSKCGHECLPMQRHLLNEDTISALSSCGVIPKYGFPIDVIELLTDGRRAKDVDLKRDMAIGLYEYAPGQVVIANKHEFDVYSDRRGVLFNDVSFTQLHHGAEGNGIVAWFCPNCKSIHDTQENFDFVALYDQWRNGHLRLRCQSIMSSLVIHSNGDVPLCQNLDVVLGNIHRQSLDEIFNGTTSCQTQCHYSKNCNDCWINFHRKYDIILLRNMERLLPKRLIEKFYGPYQWTEDSRTTYHQYFRNI